MAYGMGAGGGPDAGQMDAGEIEGPSSQGGGDASSVGPGTGRNPDNPARGVSFDAPNLSGLMGNVTGMLGFSPAASVPGIGVGVESAPTAGHPDFGISGTALDPNAPSPGVSLTDPGYSKAVDPQGKALSYNMARQNNLWGEFGKKAQSLREQLAKERAKTKKDYGKIRELTNALQAIERSPQYSKHMALQNPALGYGAKALATLMGLGPLSFAQSIENRAIELGFIDDTTPDDAIESAMSGPQYGGGGDDFLEEEIAPSSNLPEQMLPVMALTQADSVASPEQAGIVWKPVSEADGNLVILTPSSFGAASVTITDAAGNVLDTGRGMGRTNGNRHTYRFSMPGAKYGNNVYLNVGSRRYLINNPASRVN